MDIMIDLETLANSSNSAITQIGSVIFDRYSGEIHDKFKINVDAQSCIDIGLEMNVDTVEWWMKQSEEARKSIYAKPRYNIDAALLELSIFFRTTWENVYKKDINDYEPKDVKLWCHASFDEPILRNAYKKCNIPLPWHYHSVRDLRTLVDLADYKINYDNNHGIAHDALEDCIFQVRYTIECINKLKGK